MAAGAVAGEYPDDRERCDERERGVCGVRARPVGDRTVFPVERSDADAQGDPQAGEYGERPAGGGGEGGDCGGVGCAAGGVAGDAGWVGDAGCVCCVAGNDAQGWTACGSCGRGICGGTCIGSCCDVLVNGIRDVTGVTRGVVASVLLGMYGHITVFYRGVLSRGCWRAVDRSALCAETWTERAAACVAVEVNGRR